MCAGVEEAMVCAAHVPTLENRNAIDPTTGGKQHAKKKKKHQPIHTTYIHTILLLFYYTIIIIYTYSAIVIDGRLKKMNTLDYINIGMCVICNNNSVVVI